MSFYRTIKQINEEASIYGGRCLSKSFVGLNKPLLWMCKRGHTWDAPYSIFIQKGWCTQCARTDYHLEELQKIAAKKGGKCLSEDYINSRIKLSFRCAQNHTWKAISSNIKNGHWCPVCAKTKLSIVDFQKIAAKKGGLLLTKTYEGLRIKHKWQCAEGHKFFVEPAHVKYLNQWCLECKNYHHHDIREMHKIAASHGGKCLSKVYKNQQPLRWMCKEGHIWKATFVSVTKHVWCKICERNGSLNEMKSIAKSRGGACLSDKYITNKTKLQFSCSLGHIWEAIPSTIKYGHWCPNCSNRFLLGLELFQKLAQKKGGWCISKRYLGIHQKLKWKCQMGHIWESTASSIKSLHSWCPTCAGVKKLTIQDMQAIAKSRGGFCLSSKYTNSYTKLKWKCKNGHSWNALPSDVKGGTWCRICAGKKIHSIEEMQKMAQSKKGKCLSKVYINSKTPLLWECREGHKWSKLPSLVLKGGWCHQCFINERKKERM